jgi:hypothetical protein
VVEGARLESVYTGNGIAGSNPALSAFARRSFKRRRASLNTKVSENLIIRHSMRASADNVRKPSPAEALAQAGFLMLWASGDTVRQKCSFGLLLNQ